ncbi:RimJ/RimL family protein N-acetyltransferase [Salinibacterium sp. CAN_S4]|uniref:GNAT family N-acetyltransferase n=1 Tax=Salinibacterium sp. CAN_S4 TaxID=2787727 RepID=UPI0018F03C32
MPAIRPAPRVLDGSVVRLMPLEDEHLPALYGAIGRPDVFEGGYGGGAAGMPSTEAGFIEFAHNYYRRDIANVYGVWLQDGTTSEPTMVGTSTLGDFELVKESAHIGWTAYSPSVWGSAVNPESKLLMLDEAFDHGFGRIKLQADAVNARSRAAIAKLGARFEGVTRRDQLRADGTWRDAAVYSIIVDDWPEVRAGLVARVAQFAAGTS